MFIFPSNTGVSGYAIPTSTLFNGSSSKASITFSENGDTASWAWYGWVKRGRLSSFQSLFAAYINNSNYFDLYFNPNDQLFLQNRLGGSNLVATIVSSAVYRDTEWFHVSVTFNNGEFNVYVNGDLVGTLGTSGQGCIVNSANIHRVGVISSDGNWFFDGYIATDDSYFVDGSHAAPDGVVGEFNNGRWEPIVFSGTYGTNGGPVSDWTATNVTAVTNTPTDVAALWNALIPSSVVLSQGNTKALSSANSVWRATAATIPFKGKTYIEIEREGFASQVNMQFGIIGGDVSGDLSSVTFAGATSNGASIQFISGDAYIYVNGGGAVLLESSVTTADNDIYMIAFDESTKEMWVGVNGTWLASGDPANGTNPSHTFTNSVEYFASVSSFSVLDGMIIKEAAAFTYVAPTGFNDLSVANLTPDAITSGTVSSIGEFQYTGGEPSSISGVTVDEIFALGFTSTNTGAWTCTVSDPIGGDVMPRGVAN